MSDEIIENPVAKVDFKEAKALADLISIANDLGAVMLTCSRLMQILNDSPSDNILIENLWTGAIIRYARCFATGKRFGLSEDIFKSLKGEPLKAHKFYIDTRNKHIAHSVNPFEQLEVGLVLSPKDSKKEVIGVAKLSMRYMSPDTEGVRTLGCLAKVAHQKLSEKGKELEQKVLEVGKKMDIEDLYKRSRPRLTAPDPESAGNAR